MIYDILNSLRIFPSTPRSTGGDFAVAASRPSNEAQSQETMNGSYQEQQYRPERAAALFFL